MTTQHDSTLDIEMVRLCAAAMEIPISEASGNQPQHLFRIGNVGGSSYWPLTDDVQAMSLAKRFMLKLDLFAGSASLPQESCNNLYLRYDEDSINRAIVMCISDMFAASRNQTPNSLMHALVFASSHC